MKIPGLQLGWTVLTVLCCWLGVGAQDLDEHASGQEIAEEAERVHQGFRGERSELTLILISADGGRTERRLTLELLEDLEEGNQSRIDIDWPANVRGTVLLTHAREKENDYQWLYLPAARRVRRISAGNRTGSFMGSEFTYEDLTPPILSKYTHRRLDDGMVNGRPCFKMERRPQKQDSGYNRQLVWLDKQHLIPLKIEFYDRKDELLKVASYQDYRSYGSFRRAALVRMENHQTQRASELRTRSRQLGLQLDEGRFRSYTLGP